MQATLRKIPTDKNSAKKIGKPMNIRKLHTITQLPTHRAPRGPKLEQMTSNIISKDSRALLRMTARDRRALGNPDTNHV